jgi:hypothetical protein
MSATDDPILLSVLVRDRNSNADSACLLDEPFQGFQHADTRFRFRIQLAPPLPLRLRRAFHCFSATFANGSPHVKTLTRTGATQSSSCRRSKESRSDRPTNLETRHRKCELDPVKADGIDQQLRVVTWPGVEMVVSRTLSSMSRSL